ncbi:MAG TPA: endonuclease/exonuclease/phosphatase family protein [Pseudonocardiaceae bacterium]
MPLPRHSRSARTRIAVAALATGTLTAGVAVAPAAGADPASPAPGVVIAEVYGGGGNSGAPLTTDFVELANAGADPVDLTGLSVQYLPARPGPTSRWQVTPVAGLLQPGQRHLVAEARGSGGGLELPTPDSVGGISMSSTAGTVALVSGTEPLTCLTAEDCAADPRIRDLVGYGDATVRKGRPAPAASNTTSVARDDRLTDTGDNAADFTAGVPTPTNSRGEGPGDSEPQPEPEPGTVRIHDIQGTTRVSPLVGRRVTGVPGVVTAVRAFGSARGFWIQDPEPDDDPRTSEGVFVFTGQQTPQLQPGDAVLVSGRVDEYYPLGQDETPQTTPNQSITQIGDATWTVVDSGVALPPAEILTPTTVPDAFAPDAGGGTIEPLALQPDRYALDYFESREGMRLRVDDARVVGPTDAYNALWVTTKPEQNPTARGGTHYPAYGQENSGRLKIESLIPFAERPFPQANVGDRLLGTTEGPLDYSRFGGYVLQATTLGEHVSGGLTPEVTRAQRPWELAVATYNVENLSAVDDQAKFDQLARGVVTNLASPDVIALEEIQDDTGPTDDGVVSAERTLARFVDAIVAAGGPRYQWRQIDPLDKQDGGQPGGNIRVAFLFNPKRVTFVDRPGGDATTPVQVRTERGRAALSVSPGRIDPANPAWEDSRKPLVGEFRFHGRTVFVVANHFNSKGGDQPVHGRFQPPNRSSEEQRVKQATLVRQFVDELRQADRRANVVVLGDLNDYLFSPALSVLRDGDVLRAPMAQLPPGEQYTYLYDGNSQTLDHVLIGSNILVHDYDVVHINAEFCAGCPQRASDHDPQVLRFVPTNQWWTDRPGR